MTRIFYFTGLLFFISSHIFSQTTDSLRQKLVQIVSAKNAVVGISIAGSNGRDAVSINGDQHFPLQSVFKFHIALVVLSQIDQGKLSLDQKIEITEKELLPNLYSPIREKYPQGASLPVSEILEYTVSESDNVGCDVLLRLIGGPQVVEAYFLKQHFSDISIKFNEEIQQGKWDLQFQNWTTPIAANKVMEAFYYNQPPLLSKKNYDFLWKIMKETGTGVHRLKGELPPNTIVAHKTGSSGVNKDGITAAVNDIGIVFLPSGQYYFISVFVTGSKEDPATNEKIIADISNAAWNYFIKKLY